MTLSLDEPLRPGFEDPGLESQAAFRTVLRAMARPGLIQDLAPRLEAPAPLQPVSAAVCLTLLDVDTALWLDEAARGSDGLRRYLAFHCGCPLVEDPAAAGFALITDPLAIPPLGAFNQGTAEYPDRSTTLVLQVEALDAESGPFLRGPGIEDRHRLDAAPLPADFWPQALANNGRFPCGVDLIFAAPARLAALPRSTKLEID